MPVVLPYQPSQREQNIDLAKQLAMFAAKAYLAGQIGPVANAIPTPSSPGTFNFPPGSQSPLEAAQIQQMGGVPTQQGVMAHATQQPGTAGIAYQPGTHLGLPIFAQQAMERQLQQQQLQQQAQQFPIHQQLDQMKLKEAQQALDPNAPMNQFLMAQASRMRQNGGSGTGGFYQPGDIVERAGQRWKIVGFDTDGMPMVDPE